jgi:hypothetical protein
MPTIRAAEVPAGSLLSRYVVAGAYADCYVTDLSVVVSHARFVEAFYTTALFKLERLLLGILGSPPSTDAQARELARGERPSFAAWSVEARASNELLVRAGRTRSWFMVATSEREQRSATRLYFGSAVVPQRGRSGLGALFGVLLGFHKLYSRALLLSARTRLARQEGQDGLA